MANRENSGKPRAERNPWLELIEAANQQIDRINRGDRCAAMEALRMAAVGLQDVLAGREPDAERRVYLRFLVAALDQIKAAVEPGKALGLQIGNRPPIDVSRDLVIFMRVGLELDKLVKTSAALKPVKRAIANTAKRYGIGKPTIRKAWQSLGVSVRGDRRTLNKA